MPDVCKKCIHGYTHENLKAHNVDPYIHMHAYAHIQDFILAFMMGTHERVGADSPVRLLDPHVSMVIAHTFSADKWSVHVCMRVCVCIDDVCV